MRHPILGPIAFEYSAFAVDGRPDLCMVVYIPATPDDAENIKSLTAGRVLAGGTGRGASGSKKNISAQGRTK
jgi:hypothetical protein